MRRFLWATLSLAVAGFIASCTTNPSDQPEATAMPWQMVKDKDGALTIMGVTLGKTSATGAMRQFNSEPEIVLFVDQAGKPSLEAYYGNISTGGLTGTVIANLEVNERWATDAMSRAAKIEKAANGDKKITLSFVDYRASVRAIIMAITYLPSIHLDEGIVRNRFGEPTKKVEGDGGIVYFLYPESGAIVTLDPKGKESIQYVLPDSFEAMATKATGATS